MGREGEPKENSTKESPDGDIGNVGDGNNAGVKAPVVISLESESRTFEKLINEHGRVGIHNVTNKLVRMDEKNIGTGQTMTTNEDPKDPKPTE